MGKSFETSFSSQRGESMKIAQILFLALALPLLVHSAHGTPPTTVSGFIAGTSFTFTSIFFADNNTIYTVTVTTLLTGALTGSGVDYATLVVHRDGSFNAQHLSTCSCTFAGRSGTLNSIFNLKGSMVTRVAIGRWTILSGTGDLALLHGQGTLNGAPFVGANYSLEVHFQP